MTMTDWIVPQPYGAAVMLGREGEHDTRIFALQVDDLGNWDYTLDLDFADGTSDIVALAAVAEGMLEGVLSRTTLRCAGQCKAQIRGTATAEDGEILVKKSNVISMEVPDSVGATEAYPTVLPSEFLEMESRVSAMQESVADAAESVAENAQAAVDAAEVATAASLQPPYVGDNGHWFVFDVAAGVFVDTGVAATGDDGAPGAAGADGLTTTITMNDTTYTVDDDGDIDLGDVVQRTNPYGLGAGIYQVSTNASYATALTDSSFGLQTTVGTLGLVSYNSFPVFYFGDVSYNPYHLILEFDVGDGYELVLWNLQTGDVSPIATIADIDTVEESFEADLAATYTQIMNEVDTKIATAIGTALGGSY